VLEDAFLTGLIVVAGHVKEAIGSGFVGVTRHRDRFARGVRPGACYNGNSTIGGFDDPFYDFGVFFMV
jgi:hypothetical protein